MRNRLAALVFFGLASLAGAEAVTEIPKISFAGGVDYKTTCSEITDERACDSSNMINDRLGAAIKRNGGRRYTTVPISSQPITSLYKAYVTSNTVVWKALIASTWDRIYRSTNDSNPVWVNISSGYAYPQHYNYVTMNNRVLITGDRLTNHILSYDVVADTMGYLLNNDGSSSTVIVQAKYHTQSRNYYLAANVRDVTLLPSSTYYPSRVYYSKLLAPSSMTVQRFFDVRTNDGEEITGIAEMFGRVLIFKPSSIHDLTFTILELTGSGGDQVLAPLVYGFGCIAPRTLVNTGQYLFFLAKDGFRIYDGGRRSRLDVSQESRVISQAVEPIINRIINSGTYLNANAVYYAKKQWIVLSYEDPLRSPQGRANSVLIYDIPSGEWFPFKNWNAECFATQDGPTDLGDLLYGQSDDGYVYLADQTSNQNDPRTELVIDTLDSTATASTNVLWQRGVLTTSSTHVYEGTGSVRIIVSPSIATSSMTYFRTINFGEFTDKSPITKDDKLLFNVFPSSISNITSIRVDLEINDTTPNGDFDGNFTSVTIASAALINGNSSWYEIGIKLSSFPLLNEWTSLSIESFPWANSQTVYGIRFNLTGIGDASMCFDNLRVGKGTERPLDAYRLSKQWNFGTVADKRFRQVILNAEKGADSTINMDVFTNFGKLTRRISVPAQIDKQIFVSGFGSTENITKLDSIDLSVIEATQATNRTVFAIRPLTTDSQYLYGGDQFNNRIVKIDKSSMSVFVATYGALGTGTTNFWGIYQICGDDLNLYIADFRNHRVKVHRKENLEFVAAFGTLGSGATGYHNPTGVAVDETYLYVGQDGNGRVQKLDKSTGGYVTSTLLNENTIGDITLHVDEQYLFVAYNVLSATSVAYQEVVLEQRNKSDLTLVARTSVRPSGAVNLSTYALTGDIGGSDQYLWIPITDNSNRSAGTMFYIQKRLKSDLSLVKQYSSTFQHYAVAHNGVAYNPKRTNIIEDILANGSYLQLKYIDSGLDNNMKLFSQSFAVIPQGFQEK